MSEYPQELYQLAELLQNEEAAGDRDRRPTVAQTLVEMAMREIELWHDSDGEGWATVVAADGRRSHMPIKTKSFRDWLARRYYETEGRVPGAQALQDALAVLDGAARYDGAEHKPHVRVAEQGGKVYIDLGRGYAEVDADGWRVVADVPVRFWRPKGFLPLPTPLPGGDLAELRRFIRGSEEDFVLIVAWILGALKPTGPYPILDVSGEQGTGKTTACKVIRALVDPASVPLRRPPREEREAYVAASNCHVLAFDNLSGVQDWLSDALCNISTGGGFSTRALYSDRDENIMSASNPVLCNGIPELATRADLRDRTLLVALDKLDDTDRVDEKALWAEFEDARPRLLGALLGAVSAALRHWADVTMDRKPRMVDFARWVAAAEMGGALPWEPGRFLSVYMRQRDSIAAEALESDTVAQAILQLVEGAGTWTGTASELLADLGAVVDDQTRRSKTWPQTPRNLSNRLRRLAPDLRRGAGVEVEFGSKGRDKSKKRVIRIWTQTNVPSVPNVPEAQNSQAWRGIAAGTQKAKYPILSSPPGVLSSPPRGAGDAKRGRGDDRPISSSPQKPSNHAAGDDGDDGDAKMQTYSFLRVVDEL